jgi:hypothetical protein
MTRQKKVQLPRLNRCRVELRLLACFCPVGDCLYTENPPSLSCLLTLTPYFFLKSSATLTSVPFLAPKSANRLGDSKLPQDPKELHALYSNRTFKGNDWIGHFRTDGKGIFIAKGGKPVPRTWEVKGNDQVCSTSTEVGVTNCFRFQRHRKNRNEVMMTNVKDGMIHIITVEDGIPKF